MNEIQKDYLLNASGLWCFISLRDGRNGHRYSLEWQTVMD